MNQDLIPLIINAAVLVLAYVLGRRHGRKAEQESASRIAPLPGNTRTQDGPPPKNRA